MKCYKEKGSSGLVNKFTVVIFFGIACWVGGCEQSFQPLKENTQFHFSLYGFLDTSADTQWVRVAPPREQLEMDSAIPEMQVTLEEINGMTQESMISKLIKLRGSYYLNAWTTMNISNNTTYRLHATGPNGGSSQVTVTTPPDFPTPVLRYEPGGFFGMDDVYTLLIEDVERLADVQTKWYVRTMSGGIQNNRTFSFSYRNKAELSLNGILQVVLEVEKELETIMEQVESFEVLHRQVVIASAGPEWDEEVASIDEIVYALPDGFSNVEDGLGYVVGVNRKWIPYRECEDEQKLITACPEEKPFW